MTLIYLVVSAILAAMVWVCSQLDWQYGYVLMYFCLFMTSWYVCLTFIYQEEYDRTRKFSFFTIPHLIYYLLGIALLVIFWKYNLKDWKVVKYAMYKGVIIMNLVQGSFLMIYFKLRDFYVHM